MLGFFWSFFNPLLLLLVYTFVFTVIMPGTHPADIQPYGLFFFCGILPWTWFCSSLTESANVLISGGNLIKKVLFPAEVLPIVAVLANMAHFFLGLPILAVLLIYYQRPLDPLELLWFPVIVVVQFLFTTGTGAAARRRSPCTSATSRTSWPTCCTLWFFSTPIIYSMQMAPENYRWVLNLNPDDPPDRSRTRRCCSTSARTATGSGCWRSAPARSWCSWPATSSSIGCAIRSRRR